MDRDLTQRIGIDTDALFWSILGTSSMEMVAASQCDEEFDLRCRKTASQVMQSQVKNS